MRLDPDFDPAPTRDWLLKRQEPAGWWRALNPEVPWLTAAVVNWLEQSRRPFWARFEWPSSPIWALDRLSRLTTIATLEELEVGLRRLPRLADQPVETAFLDLAGFRAWNSRHGQVRGDEVIKLLGRSLGDLPDVLSVRIGGDEILMIGKPAAPPRRLWQTLEAWRHGWPAQLAQIGAEGVAPRIVVEQTDAGRLKDSRDRLGQGSASSSATAPIRRPRDGSAGSARSGRSQAPQRPDDHDQV